MRVQVVKRENGHVDLTVQSNRVPPVPPVVVRDVHNGDVAQCCRDMIAEVQSKRVELTLPGF